MTRLPLFLIILSLVVLIILSVSSLFSNNSEINAINEENKDRLNMSSLSMNDQDIFNSLKKNIQLSQQLAKELEVLLVNFQKNDELTDAIEMMATAKDEVRILLNEMKNMDEPKNKELGLLKSNFEKLLSGYVNGLSLQLAGIDENDVQKVNKGYRLMEENKQEILKVNISAS